MKKVFSLKFISLIVAFALSVALAFSFYGVKQVSAADVTSPDAYFGGSYQSLEFKNDNLVATVKNDGTLSFSKPLVIDDFALELNIPWTDVAELTVTFKSDSYFTNGAFKDDTSDTPDTKIENVLYVTSGEFRLNGIVKATAIPETAVIGVSVDADGVLTAKIAGETVVNDNDYYKIKGADKHIAEISLEFVLVDKENGTAEVSVISVDQNASVAGYKQTFVTEDGKIKDFAKPRVAINNPTMVKDDAGNFKPLKGYRYSLNFTTYSVFGGASTVYLASADENIEVDGSTDTPKNIVFKNADASSFTVRNGDYEEIETYNVTAALIRDNDEEAPKYIDYIGNESLYADYQKLVTKAALKEYTDDDDLTIVRSIRLGDTYEIPSLENLVTDNYDVYSSLSYTVYYRTPSNGSGSATSLKFTVSDAGDYEFFVIFKDKAGNALEKDDFYTVNEDDANQITEGTYYYAVFKFTVEDNAPLYVISPYAAPGTGYLNTKYTATAFKIQSSGNNTVYTLWYNANAEAGADDEGWVKIPLVSEISEDYSENGFTYSDIENIAYDGAYTFTPTKKGAYKIDCYVTSENSVRFAQGNTVIKVTESPTVVKVDTHWLKNNIWSVVFLSIGTLSLIGIIVLLFIKPKEEIETDETGDALKARK